MDTDESAAARAPQPSRPALRQLGVHPILPMIFMIPREPGTEVHMSIAPEHLPRITERFYRVDRSRSRETGGTGLGLSIVKAIVERHGGTIAASNDNGAVFDLVLPVTDTTVSPSGDAPPAAA